MKTINIAKAQPNYKDAPNESITIVIDQELPRIDTCERPTDSWMKESDARFQSEAVKLADALQASLPGGTLERLICELLRRKASHFVVRIDS